MNQSDTAAQSNPHVVLPLSTAVDYIDQLEDPGLETDEIVLAIRRYKLELEDGSVQLRRRQKALRIHIGEGVWKLHEKDACPGCGTFLQNVTRAGLTVPTAYRYMRLYLGSIGLPAPESLSTDKESQAGNAEPSEGAMQPQGQVTNPDQLARVQPDAPKPPRPLPVKHPVLKYNDAEQLEYRFYLDKLRGHCCKEIPSGDEAHIVLQALRSVANECSYFYIAPDLTSADRTDAA